MWFGSAVELPEWRQLSEWVGAVWPQPGCDDEQIAATYFLVADLDRADAEAALREHALTRGVAATPHPSEIRQLTNSYVRTRRRSAPPSETTPDEQPADHERVSALLADLRAELGRRPHIDPLAFDRSTLTSVRARTAAADAAREAG